MSRADAGSVTSPSTMCPRRLPPQRPEGEALYFQSRVSRLGSPLRETLDWKYNASPSGRCGGKRLGHIVDGDVTDPASARLILQALRPQPDPGDRPIAVVKNDIGMGPMRRGGA